MGNTLKLSGLSVEVFEARTHVKKAARPFAIFPQFDSKLLKFTETKLMRLCLFFPSDFWTPPELQISFKNEKLNLGPTWARGRPSR
jgi:hypothetical protein